MRSCLLVLALALALFSGFKMYSRARAHNYPTVTREWSVTSSAAANATTSKFETEVRPILQAQCKPCHFPGGTQYQHLPFDQPETIKKLGEKLFTRIHNEKDRRVIREFLSQP